VWQDFMFACAAYPEDREFLNEVEEEVKENVLRLQRHPSLAIWCGNNENEWNWVKDKCGNLNMMPGFTIFHKLIPGLLKELDPLRPYWPSSPFGMDSDPNDYASGNTHQWDIWSKWIDYTEVVNDKSLFVSEFGFQGPANYHTFQKCIPEKEFKPQSRVFEFHNKQEDGPERIYRFLSAHLPIPKDIKSYIYLAQLNQALALKTCLEHWRMRWPETGGSIVWQLNDCWPVTSWALIDSEVNPKLAYYDVKRTFANPLINFQETEDHLDILLKNFSNNQLSGYLNLVEITLPEGNIKEIEQIKIDDISKGIETNKVISISKLDLNNKAVLVASLNDSKGGLINRTYFTPGPWKYLHLPQLNKIPEIEWDDVNNKIIITTTTPCFFIKLRHPDLFFSDNGFILLPGEKKSISILKGLIKDVNKEELEICCLNQYLD
ncbi:MAG: hypothetical protein KAR38_07840, partial [Calditrichia bacterium]|nr:hypothetical protein [Calditrichia bacterium]